ncbi:MAG TPA: hypothetical protein DCR20_13780, partial [Planctomycetaceae bacterium]|nr:hypothetical protein [Planctomycetaceae bacterium]
MERLTRVCFGLCHTDRRAASSEFRVPAGLSLFSVSQKRQVLPILAAFGPTGSLATAELSHFPSELQPAILWILSPAPLRCTGFPGVLLMTTASLKRIAVWPRRISALVALAGLLWQTAIGDEPPDPPDNVAAQQQ